MSLFKKITGMFKKEDTFAEHKENGAISPLKKRYQAFQSLLSSNNSVLEAMADMEEKLSGEFLFDRRYVESGVQTITGQVKNIIDNLNLLTRKKYVELDRRYDEICSQIDKVLVRKTEIPVSEPTIPFAEITKDMADKVGSKVANLGEIKTGAALPVPDGFGITAFSFKKFMEHNKFIETINARLAALSVDNLVAIEAMSREIQSIIAQAEVQPDLVKDIHDAYARLCKSQGEQVMVSVRSSALQEDGEFSFAGQYSTFLNVSGDSIVQRYKDVVASLFNQRALFYYKTKGIQDYDMVMPVGVLTMVDAKASGVMYSRDPNDPKSDTIIISAVRGLGKSVVDGTVTPETYLVSRGTDKTITGKRLPRQDTMLVCNPSGGIKQVPVKGFADGKQCLTDEEIQTLAGFAIALEGHFRSPQDIEWAIDNKGRPFILQSRPLRILAREAGKPVPRRVKGYDVLIERGAIACKGIGFGTVHIVKTDDDLKDFPDGGVLVAKRTSTKFVMVMNKASAIITDVGATTGHMASLSREYQVPSILDTDVATSVLKQGQYVTVDAVNCNVYSGHVAELEEFAVKKDEPFKDSQVFKTLEKVLKWIVPLNLVDPDAENFVSQSCATLHDITRFCHEMVMRELFNIVDMSTDDVHAVRLVTGIPMEIYLLDLGGGISELPKYLNPEHISSAPFNAFLQGLRNMKWPEPRAFDVKGFLGAVAHTATVSEEEIRKTAEKSFSFITKDYMNFAIRLGYHLSTVEAFAGENINDNYIKFFFKGGGAAADRRLRRIRLISEILKCLDFNIKVIDDVLEGSLTKYRKDAILERLEVMGKFTVYTKQLDMVMYNDTITTQYINDFCKQQIPAKLQ